MSETSAFSLYQQNTDLACLVALIPYLQQKSFLDIGAEKGTFTLFLHEKGLRGVLFEPLPKFAEELAALAQETSSTFLPYAVDDKDRIADFYIACDQENHPMDYFSSLHPLHEDDRIIHKKAATVTCRSLDSLLKDGLIQKEIGIVKIDTEGNDLNVLKGMQQIKPEILMCEFFMPGIYAGWELGHAEGLIAEAKKLGFNHFIAIKRIDEYELVSLDTATFIDKQWGNLIFLSDTLFHHAKSILDQMIAEKERVLLESVLKTTQMLRQTCEERLAVINVLDNEIKRLHNEAKPQEQALMNKLKDKLRTWL